METPKAVKARDTFTTGLGVIAATLGSAVGLGNIWKFPALTGLNGGAAFIVVYLLSTLMAGLPVMIAELMLGRRSKSDALTTFRVLHPERESWSLIGAAGVLSAFLILAFYTEVAGWVFAYIFKAASGSILSADPKVTSAAFAKLIADPVQSVFWQCVVIAFVGAIIVMGVSKGIEKTTKRLMPVLFLILVMIGVRSLMLPGAAQGLDFLFRPDFSKVTGAVVLTAMGLAFFKLSVGMGTMITYGSYFRNDQNVPMTALRVMLADLTVSILAGVAIFPAVFTFGFKPEAGPSLLFITIPAVFSQMPFGNVFVVLFFVLGAIASTGAMLSIMEVPVAYLHQRFGVSRFNATAATGILLALIGSTAALSNSVLSEFKLFGMTMFDLYDFLTSNLLMPVGGLFICIFVGWVWGEKQVRAALSNDGQLQNGAVIGIFFFIVRYVAPVTIGVILLRGLKII
ncbi:sodium-dependent transporter, SNF family [Geoanaerobacter pelophilus]|uniref:Sodium-dependent transporter, SNF family n=1 Tax=Geoanaerobacter pelophilus TaxID=60036 RepID=A0ABQ0MHK5_9BACT|nr:sodium-dependent transporter [Geoanaerobacter pelophilus]GAW66559.1 sodium-dependent transporter, SNF family [Geoanaerobacter pelophilus]